MRRFTLLAVLFAALALSAPGAASASCHTHHCWQRVHVNKLERMVKKRIARITPYRCFGERSVKPCAVIAQESSNSGLWRAWNPLSCGSGYHARGLYQLCGHGEPWPVIVTWGKRLWRRYRTLKNELAHHRIAARLGMGHWGM